MTEFFPILILNARPAAGKSEIVQALQQMPVVERVRRFHVGPLHVLDDFPLLWSWFEEDRLLEREFGRPRLHTTPDEYFLYEDLWHLLVRRLGLAYDKFVRDESQPHTAVIEFSRGAEHGGYRAAYRHLSHEILRQAACLYVRVSYAESRRKNRQRFNPQRPDSILQHGLSDEKLEHLYRVDDWDEWTAADPICLPLVDHRVPYVVFENEDDVTTRGGAALLSRLETTLGQLWKEYRAARPSR
jgi:hypothetical protein